MARTLRLASEAEMYHVLNRGNDRADIFWSEKAREAFLNINSDRSGTDYNIYNPPPFFSATALQL